MRKNFKTIIGVCCAFVFVLTYGACTSKSPNKEIDQEMKEIIELEESTQELETVVEDLDSAVDELKQIDNLLN